MTITNLRKMYALADDVDRREGLTAYPRYHDLMKRIATQHGFEFARVIAAFVALSPSSDYVGNLRSLVSVLKGINDKTPLEEITVSGYKHCRNRAYKYLTGQSEFWNSTKGPKIRNFYMNILHPQSPLYCTIDGHIVAAWCDKSLTMRGAIVRPRVYTIIMTDMMALAEEIGILPNQLQATLWFTRKRIFGIKVPHSDLFLPPGDEWQINRTEIRPYA